MSEWRNVTLADISDRVDYGYTASASEDPALPRLLRITDIAQTHLDWSGVPGCPIDGKNLSKYKLATDDIVVARTGATVGYAKRIRTHPEAVFASYLVRFRLAPEAAPSFVGAIVESSDYKRWVQQNAGGAAQPNASAKVLSSFPLRLPDKETQVRIGAVFDTIADLIENNRRRVEVLEEMARAIYREWFVEFRYPGHEDVPMVDSALGPIPEGWKVGTVRHASAVVVRGISPKYAEDGEWVVINQKCIRDGRVSLGPSRRQEREVSDAKRIRAGDVLINSTGVGTLGRVAMYRGSSEGVTVDSHVTIARPVQDSLNPWYAMSILDKQSEIERLGAGATGQTELRKTDVEALDLLRPAQNVIEAFAAVVSPLFGQTDVLSAGIETLSALRDLLLPKLVTGQIDVSTLDLDALIAEQVS